MNHIHRSLWNDQTGTFVAVSENTRSAGKKISPCSSASGGSASFQIKKLAFALMLACGSVQAQPTGGVVAAGSATIGGTAGNMRITQNTPNVAINWQSFGIKAGESVQFVQPSSSSVALNRVVGADPSQIFGNLSANGKVFLVNPNGILFGQGASVNVGGLVASTLALSDSDFMANNYKFAGAGAGTVVNQGAISAADGGYVALLGANVSNQGVISARFGTVALAAGNAVTLDLAGDKLLNITVDQGAVNALVENTSLIQADGGSVLMTTQAAGSLLSNAVNNTGVIQAQTLQNVNGTIMLLGGMENGTVNVGGTLDASAPNGGNGGFIETSAKTVNIANDVKVTTNAAQGQTGNWLIDPQDFIIGAGGNISGATLSAQLVTNNILITTPAGNGNGDIFVNDPVSWTASSTPTTLTLVAARDVNINKAITATNGNLVACCGRDVNVNAAITTVNGSILLAAGHNANINAAITTTDGNVTMCAAKDVNVGAAITLTRPANTPSQSLGLASGLVLSAGFGGTGPGAQGGTLVFASGVPKVVVTNAPVTIYYNPVSYAAPTDYLPKFTLTGSALTDFKQFMLVFPDGGDKTYDGTTKTTLTGLKGNPVGVTLEGLGTAAFDTADIGPNKAITFSGYKLGGTEASKYALPNNCCNTKIQITTANITGSYEQPPVVVPPPVVVHPPVVPVLVNRQPLVPLPDVMPLPNLMPPPDLEQNYRLVEEVPVPLMVTVPVPVIVPVVPPPKVYVPPVRKPKQDRN